MSEKASGRRERGAESRAWLSRTTHPISSPNQGKTSMQNNKVRELANFIWGTADTLRGKFKAHDYGKVILPFFVLRRLDCLLSATQDATIEMADSLPEGIDEDTRDLLLFDVAKAGRSTTCHPSRSPRSRVRTRLICTTTSSPTSRASRPTCATSSSTSSSSSSSLRN